MGAFERCAAGLGSGLSRSTSADYIDFGCHNASRSKSPPKDVSRHIIAPITEGRSPRAASPVPSSPSEFWRASACVEATGRSIRGQTEFSTSMHHGAGTVQALSYAPDTPRVGRCGSLPPKLFHGQAQEDRTDGVDTECWLKRKGGSPACSPRTSPIRSPRHARLGNSPSRSPRVTASQAETVLTGKGERTACKSPQSRLRGDGKAIGQAGKSSGGIPFNRIPVYNSQGVMLQSISERSPRMSRGLSEGEFSYKLTSGNGARSLLTFEEELKTAERPQSPDHQRKFHNWLEVLHEQCLASKEPSSPPSKRSPGARRAPSPDEDRRPTHFVPKKLLHGLPGSANTKDTCPFNREDSSSRTKNLETPKQPARGSAYMAPAMHGGVQVKESVRSIAQVSRKFGCGFHAPSAMPAKEKSRNFALEQGRSGLHESIKPVYETSRVGSPRQPWSLTLDQLSSAEEPQALQTLQTLQPNTPKLSEHEKCFSGLSSPSLSTQYCESGQDVSPSHSSRSIRTATVANRSAEYATPQAKTRPRWK
eukprot:TRINITY_DN63797_c0_g1_i1.p1 TRINITY_DN63797_c0_g1~~TRINITY_DN63797_c0_g1_i1.p1  ORF type:complete len:535 (-),score=50.42 TRINITY_DN63797_c0_g1_i1:110-1714(-)